MMQQQPVQNVVVVKEVSDTKTNFPEGHWPTVSTQVECFSCKKTGMTRTEEGASVIAWVLCIIMGVFGLWLCCWIPFCCDGLKDTKHHCQHCGVYLGKHQGNC